MDRNSHPTCYGVDGCRSGWFWVALLPGGEVQSGIAEKLGELVDRARNVDRIFLDMPIGLQTGPRACDVLARKLLGRPRASSVFPAPTRDALHSSSYEDANQRNRAVAGKGLTKQTYSIMPEIREVDDLLRASEKARRIVREAHPEVCFRGFAGHAMQFHKKKPEGYWERVRALENLPSGLGPQGVRWKIEDMFARHGGSGVALDDIVDAMAAAGTATAHRSVLRSLPELPERDSQGLPMEMVYADASLTSRAQTNAPGNAAISPEVRERIEDELRDIELRNSVRILLAVESGSRAWGFPSPDSDYDVRFLYVRPRDWYLSVNSRRDVIECPVVDVLDINGWDVRKALGLLLKANPVLSEWLCSPVRYMEIQACTQRLRALADRVAFERPARFHYLHLGRSAYNAKIGNRETVAMKKYFYADSAGARASVVARTPGSTAHGPAPTACRPPAGPRTG